MPRAVEPAPAEQVSPASTASTLSLEPEEFLEIWLQHLFAWRSDAERNVLMRMIYMTLEERGVLECDLPGPNEEDFPQDPKYDLADYPSPFLERGGICEVIFRRAQARSLSPEKFLEQIFGDSISADQVFYALFGETPPNTRGRVFPKKGNYNPSSP